MNHRRPHLFLLALSALAVTLLAARVAWSGHLTFVFLAWNLVLAWVPYLLGLALAAAHRRGRPGWALAAWGVPWLAFLPNAPYLVTDFVHLRTRTVPLAFDAALLGVFAASGLALAVAALLLVHRVVAERAGAVWGWATALAVVALNSVGVYLGRVHRFNSWDIVADPSGLWAAAAGWLREPAADPRLVVLLLGGTVALGLLYAATWAAAERRLAAR